MAYNNGFPVTYQPYYQAPIMQQPVQMIPQQYQQPSQQPQTAVMQGGFVRIPSENDARMYPVAPGNSVTFIDENKLYIYTKTVNMGQLDRPIFEKYRLVKENGDAQAVEAVSKPVDAPAVDLSNFVIKRDFDEIKGAIDEIKSEIDTFRGDLYGIAGKKKASAKKEVVTDE